MIRFHLSPYAAVALMLLPLLASSQPPDAQGAMAVGAIAAQVLAQSPEARAAQQRFQEAQAARGVAIAQLRMQPVFDASVSGSAGELAQPPTGLGFYTALGTLSVPIPNVRRGRAGSAEARSLLQAAHDALQATRLSVELQATDAYYTVIRARGEVQVAQSALAQAHRQVLDTQKRVDAGYLPPADILSVQVPEAAAKAALALAENQERIAESSLNSLLVRQLTAPVSLAAPPSAPRLTLTRDQVVAAALASSPAVLQAQDNVDAARSAVSVARHLLDPEYTAQASYQESSDISAYANLATITFNVSIPLGDGGAARGERLQAEARLKQAQEALALAKQQAELGAQEAFYNVQSSEANITATQQTVSIAQQSLVKAQQAFDAGQGTVLDVLNAQVALTQALKDANGASYDLATAWAQLRQAIGQDPVPGNQ